jgi:hypothetical protein
MLTQLRMMVANLSAQGQWLGGNSDRPVSRVKVSTAPQPHSVKATQTESLKAQKPESIKPESW